MLVLNSPNLLANDNDDLKAQFKQAYQDYKTAVQTNDPVVVRKTSRAVFEMAQKLYSNKSKTLAALSLNYGNALFSAHAYRETLVQLKTTEKFYKGIYGKNAIELVDIFMTRGQSNLHLHDYKAATSAFDKSLKLFNNLEDNHSRLIKASLQLEIGSALLETKEASSSGKYLVDAVKTYRELLGLDHQQTAVARFWRGKYYMTVGKNDRAVRELELAVTTFESKAPDHKTLQVARAYLVNIYEQEGYAIVSLTVNKDGFVRNPIIKEVQGGDAFGNAALAVVKDFRYAPAYTDGKAVDRKNVSYKFNFALAD